MHFQVYRFRWASLFHWHRDQRPMMLLTADLYAHRTHAHKTIPSIIYSLVCATGANSDKYGEHSRENNETRSKRENVDVFPPKRSDIGRLIHTHTHADRTGQMIAIAIRSLAFDSGGKGQYCMRCVPDICLTRIMRQTTYK